MAAQGDRIPFSTTFRVSWDGRVVPAVLSVGPLLRSTTVIEVRDGAGDPLRHTAGPTSYEPVVIERGATRDRSFEEWADPDGAGARTVITPARKDVRVEVVDHTGVPVLAYVLHGCWPSRYQALPRLDENGLGHGGAVVETMTLQHEGWTRDTSIGST
jgi:phage tail-like protein